MSEYATHAGQVMKNYWQSLVPEVAVIVFVTIAVYMHAFHNGFLPDDDLITNSPVIRASDGLRRIWFTTETPDYYPLTWSLLWFEWRLWGNDPTGYHVINVVLHAVNAVLVWLVLRRLEIPGAWLAALIFAIHPVNVATVAWISEQKNTLSMLFFLFAILAYLRYDEVTQPHPERGWRWYVISLTAFVLALLSKTAIVMLPVVLLLLAWWRRGRVGWRDVLRTVPFFALSVVLGFMTMWFHHEHVLSKLPAREDGFVVRLLTAGWVPWFYLYKAILPINLTVVYPRWDISPVRWFWYLPGAILSGGFAVFWWKRKTWGRPMLVGLGYFMVMLIPVLGFFDQSFFRATLVADHWQYYSIVGVIALAVAAGQKVCSGMGKQGREVGLLAAVAVVMMLGTATWIRINVYRNHETLSRDNVIKNPKAWSAQYNLGVALWKAGRVEEAIECYKEVLRLRPDYNEVRNNLGVALAETGHLDEAIGEFREYVRSYPGNPEAHNNLGLALARRGQFEQAIPCYKEAVRLQTNYVVAHVNLAIALTALGRTNDAINHYEQALRVRPDYVEAQHRLAQLQAGQ